MAGSAMALRIPNCTHASATTRCRCAAATRCATGSRENATWHCSACMAASRPPSNAFPCCWLAPDRAAERRMRRVLLGLLLLFVVLMAGVAGFLLTLDVNQYTPRIETAVREATGRDFAIAGRLGVKPSLIPTLSVEGVTLGSAPWATGGTL